MEQTTFDSVRVFFYFIKHTRTYNIDVKFQIILSDKLLNYLLYIYKLTWKIKTRTIRNYNNKSSVSNFYGTTQRNLHKQRKIVQNKFNIRIFVKFRVIFVFAYGLEE